MRIFRSKPDAWPLRRGDLLPERFVAREPRLAGLEHNPVFRIIVFQGHRFGHLSLATGILATALVAAMLLRKPFGSFGILVIQIAYVATIISAVSRRVRQVSGDRGIGFISAQYVADMAQAAVSSEAYACAFWGASVTRARIRLHSILMMVGAAVILGVLLWPTVPSLIKYVLLPGLFIVCILIGRFGFAPEVMLPACARGLLLLRRGLEARARPGRAFLRVLAAILRIALFASVVAMVIFIAISQYTAFFRVVPVLPPRLTNLPLGAAASVVIGLLAGILRGRYTRRHADDYFNQMRDHFDHILAALGESERARHETKPKP